jgi:carboxyl-terminal processing protease
LRSRAVIVAGTLSAAVICGGWFLENGLRGTAGPLRRAQLNGTGAALFDQVADHVRRDFVDSISQDSMYHAAVTGMLYELGDPHTAYLSPERYMRLQETTNGSYIGLGVQIDIRGGWITILAPVPNSPAERAGLRTGDRLVEVDGQSTQGWTQDEASKALRGEPGSLVHLTVERPGVEARIPIAVARREIHVRAVPRAAIIRPTVGYVHVTVFSDSTARELIHAVDSLRSRGAKSLVLDLRNDPGGLLAQGVEVSELFLAPGDTIVRLRGRTPGATQEFIDHDPSKWTDMPLVVLVDRGTASAAEIVAGALQDHDRAVLVGTPTYGKGSAQSIFHVDGGALKLTTARWYTPSGRSINRPTAKPDDDDVSGDTTAADTSHRAQYRTSEGRIVYGGGGITPDVIVGDTGVSDPQAAFEAALGSKLPAFRDALTAYALSLEGQHALTSPDFAVTPAMRDELYRRMRAKGIVLDRGTYDAASRYVDQQLATEVTRYVFGVQGLFTRSLTHDSVLVVAADLASRATSPADLLRLTTTPHK